MTDKKTLIIIVLATLLAFVGYCYYSAKKDIVSLEAQVTDLQAQVDSLKNFSDGLLSDKRISRINQRKINKELEKEASSDKALFSTCTISSKVIGRNAVSVETLPDVEFTEEGFVTVKVTVDESGSVVSTSIDTGNSTIKSRKIRTACKAAAQKAKFSTGSSAKARGTITYTFSE